MERSEKVFKEFIDLCRDVTRNDTVVLDLLQKRYNCTNLHFLWSDDFPNLVDRCSKKILANRDNKYVYIKEFTTELKVYKAKPLKHLRETHHDGGSARKRESSSEHGGASKRPKLEGGRVENWVRSPILGQVTSPSCTLIPLSLMSEMVAEVPKDGPSEVNGSDLAGVKTNGRLMSSIKLDEVKGLRLPQVRIELKRCKILTVDSESSQTSSSSDRMALLDSSSDHEQPPSEDRLKEEEAQKNGATSDNAHQEERCNEGRVERNIGRLEALLKKISDEIKKLQEAELSLDDMDKEDSPYTLEDRYKKRFVKVWNRLCQLKGRRATTGRETERNLHYAGTSYPEINRRISQYVNRFHTFPDYGDIVEIIEKCNGKHGLGIRKSAIERLAQNTFTDVGNILQKRRMADFAENSGCHLTDSVRPGDDPARFDSSLRQKLDANMKISKSNLEEVINKFAQKQEADGDEEEDGEEEEEKEEETEEDEEEDKAIMDDVEEMEKAAGKAEEVNSVDDNESTAVETVDETSESEETVESVSVRCPFAKEAEEKLVPEMETGCTEDDTVDRKASNEHAPTRSGDTKAAAAGEFRCVVLPPDDDDDDDDVVDVDKRERDTLSLSGDSERSFSPMSENGGKSEMTPHDADIELNVCSALDSNSGQQNTDRESSSQSACCVERSVEVPPPSSSGVAACDVICLDDDTLSPQKNKVSGESGRCDIVFGLAKTSHLKMGKRTIQNENVARKSKENGFSSPSTTLVPWQPTKEAVSDEVALLSDDDVIVIPSGNTPSKSSSSFQMTEGRQTQSASLLNGGQHCVVSTVEEQVTTTVTHNQMSSGNHVMEQKTTRRRVVGHIICFNNLKRGNGQTMAAGRAMRETSRGSRVTNRTVPVNQRDRCVRANDSTNRAKQGLHRARQQGTSVTGSGGRRTDASRLTGHHLNPLTRQQQQQQPAPHGQFHLDLDKISQEIASSVFKNPPPGKAIPRNSDVMICDDSSRSLPPAAIDWGKFPVSKRLRQQKPSKSKAALDMSPMATGSSSSLEKPLKVKNSDLSEVIELD